MPRLPTEKPGPELEGPEVEVLLNVGLAGAFMLAGLIRKYLIDVHRPVVARLAALSFLEMLGVIELSSWWDSFRLAHLQTTKNTLDRTGNNSIIKYHKWMSVWRLMLASYANVWKQADAKGWDVVV